MHESVIVQHRAQTLVAGAADSPELTAVSVAESEQLPLRTEDERSVRNHASHVARRSAAAEHLNSLLARNAMTAAS